MSLLQSIRRTAHASVAVFCTLTLCNAIALGESAENARPNIVVILVDDMGFSDIGCYGSEIPTPNLDQLAENGLKFTQFYNTGRCCPTRATVLTGLYAHQAGIGHMNDDYGVPGYRGSLNNRCVTLGGIASSAGYMSIATGKWHVGAKEKSMWPVSRGFDRFYGVPEGGGFYFQVKAGRSIALNNEVVASVETQRMLPDDWYSTDAWTDYGLKFIDEAIEADKPFLLYLAHNAPHFPLQATEADIARHRGKYLEGWDKLSEKRWKKQVEMELMDRKWQPAPRPQDVAAWDSLNDTEKDRFDHLMATYAACVERMDMSVGNLVEGLRSRGQLENTLILFMSDNGGNAESGPDGRTKGDPTTADSNWFCGKSWAWMQDTPFQKFKHYNHEGGIATPLIAHWPNGIKDPGGMRSEPTHLIDIMATVVDVTGAEYPEKAFPNGSMTPPVEDSDSGASNGSVKAAAIQPYEGVSLKPLFSPEGQIDRDTLYWEHEGNAAVRQGDWKLVRQGGDGAWQLYHMADDRTEQHDLADEKPELVAKLNELWLAWAERCNVNRDGLPSKNKKKRKQK